MRAPTILAIFGLALAMAAPAFADDASDGQKVFRTRSCMACHGAKGQKPILTYPALAGQNEKYVLQQVNDIKSGKRVGSMDETNHPFTQGMADILHILTDDDIKAVAKYLSTQTPGKPKPLDPAPTADEITAGQTAYKKFGCVTCHGADGKKTNVASYPILAGLNRDYLKRQMTDIRDGTRTNGQSKLMLAFIKKADDAAILSISTYLSQIDRSAP
jgi:cbb3-type cytochrome c oxidase subunit III